MKKMSEKKSIILFLYSCIFMLALSACADKTTKIPAYPAGDPNSKIILQKTGIYVDDEYAMFEFDVYNHTMYDLDLTVECVWFGVNDNKLADDTVNFQVNSGTKKKVTSSTYYIWDNSPAVTVKCALIKKEIVKK